MRRELPRLEGGGLRGSWRQCATAGFTLCMSCQEYSIIRLMPHTHTHKHALRCRGCCFASSILERLAAGVPFNGTLSAPPLRRRSLGSTPAVTVVQRHLRQHPSASPRDPRAIDNAPVPIRKREWLSPWAKINIRGGPTWLRPLSQATAPPRSRHHSSPRYPAPITYSSTSNGGRRHCPCC